MENIWGTYHLTNSGETSWFLFAQEIMNLMDIGNKPKLIPISSRDYPSPAIRPLNSRLSNEKIFQTFRIRLPDWKVALHQTLGNLLYKAN